MSLTSLQEAAEPQSYWCKAIHVDPLAWKQKVSKIQLKVGCRTRQLAYLLKVLRKQPSSYFWPASYKNGSAFPVGVLGLSLC